MKIAAILFSVIPALASAWHLQLYDGELYKGVLEDRRGSLTQPCKTLSESKIDRAESMHWTRDGVFGVICNVRLYADNQCHGEIGNAQYRDWTLPAFSTDHKNKLNSYKIDCDE